jgi:hypothetical protein
VGTCGIAGVSAPGGTGEVVVGGTEAAPGRGLVEQGFGLCDERERFTRIFGDAEQRAVNDEQEVDAHGWVATSAEYTRSALGARPDRVVCHVRATA